MQFPPANIQLRRAQLVLMLAVLVPTVMMTSIGILLLVLGSGATTVIAGVLVLTLCTSGITGYILVSIFVRQGRRARRGCRTTSCRRVARAAHPRDVDPAVDRVAARRPAVDDDRARRCSSLLARETQRLETLVNRVLELSQLEAGRHVYRASRSTSRSSSTKRSRVRRGDA